MKKTLAFTMDVDLADEMDRILERTGTTRSFYLSELIKKNLPSIRGIPRIVE
jgi:predicted DNA-binding protein